MILKPCFDPQQQENNHQKYFQEIVFLIGWCLTILSCDWLMAGNPGLWLVGLEVISEWRMSEKYMSIGAPMTELPLAQPRGHTSHSHRWVVLVNTGKIFLWYSKLFQSHLSHGGRSKVPRQLLQSWVFNKSGEYWNIFKRLWLYAEHALN